MSAFAEADGANKTIQSARARFRTTYEYVKLPAGEHLGLLGGDVLYNVNDWLAVGPAAYGAVKGKRGGFITLGLAADINARLNDYIALDGGVFVGGGGGRGGAQLSGGGLMLRYHAGAQLMTSWGDIGAGYSYIDFPYGTVHSGQPYVSYDYRFSTWMAPSWLKHPEQQDSEGLDFGHVNEQELSVVYKGYKIPSGVTRTDGAPQNRFMGLLGMGWNHYLNDNLFLHLESEGAMGGKSNGYMQILGGAGLRFQVLDGTWIKLMASLGPAGGGSVDTGGGLLLDAEGGLQQKLGDHMYAEATAGYVKVPGASFRAIAYSAKLGYHFFTPPTGQAAPLSGLNGYDFQHLRIRAVNQTYFHGSQNWRSSYRNLNINLLGVQADYFLNPYLYLSGEGMAAYKGKAGAYVIGLVGAGVHVPLAGPVYAEFEGFGGAAGGGGLSVGGGLVWQANAGLGCQLNDRYSLSASYGRLEAPKGALRVNVLSVSLGYNFTLFTI